MVCGALVVSTGGICWKRGQRGAADTGPGSFDAGYDTPVATDPAIRWFTRQLSFYQQLHDVPGSLCRQGKR